MAGIRNERPLAPMSLERKIKLLEASIRSLSGSRLGVTDLLLEKQALEDQLNKPSHPEEARKGMELDCKAAAKPT